MYDRILVPTDGSEGTRGAIEHAIDLAETYDAALHTVSVVDTAGGVDATIPEAVDTLEDAGESAIQDVIDRAEAAGVEPIEGVVAHGTPHSAILEYVDEQDVDLIVMGTHGRTGIDRYLVGSVAEKVVRLSDVPVLTVRMASEAEETEE